MDATMAVKPGIESTVSISSMSTRGPSSPTFSTMSPSLPNFDDLIKQEKTLALPSKQSASRRRALLLAALVALAYAWSQYIGKMARRGKIWGVGRWALAASAAASSFAKLCGVTGASDLEDNPDMVTKRQHMLCYHPHGLYVMAPVLYFANQPRNKHSPYYHQWNLVADACFKVPVFREWLVAINCRAAESQVLDSLLSQGDTVAVAPGGTYEQLATDPTVERLYFPPNLGFVRQAMKHGVPLVPLYNFGENQLYDVPAWSRNACQWFKDMTGAGVPFGIGRWGLPFLPKPGHLSLRLGAPVEVGPADPNPSDERVEEVFFAYCAELHNVFLRYKDMALPAAVAARGLQLVWRGNESLDLSEQGLADVRAAAAGTAPQPTVAPSQDVQASPKPASGHPLTAQSRL